MPKYKKGKKRVQEFEEKKKQISVLKQNMFSSSIKALIIGGIFLVVSVLFNGNFIPIESESGTALNIVLVLLKSLIIILFFAFVFIGVANSMELKGKPASIREIVFIAIISLIQSVRNVSVFWISFIGILLITLYFWAIQIKIETV